jgi:hypothetical protein
VSKLLHILLVSVALGAIGCTQPATMTTWHQQIAPVPTTKQTDAIDPENGEPLSRDFADHQFPRPLSRKAAFQVLLNTETFADAYVGYAGAKSVQVDAFQALLVQPDAKQVFSDLLDRAHTAGKLYALCAFYLIAPQAYARAEQQLMRSAGTVDHQDGCEIRSRPVCEVIRCSDPNTVRLRRSETVNDWFVRVKPPGNGAMFDIAGGAIPEIFRDAR